MEAQAVTWLFFLVLIKYVSTIPFKVEPVGLLATEGSCFEIKCQFTRDVNDHDAYWFWMKDRQWVQSDGDYKGAVIYSTNNSTRPVSPDFANRVKYIGSSSSSWKNGYSAGPKPLCSILICDLRTSDSGNYSMRFIGTGVNKWSSEEVTLNVTKNRCPLTFEKPAVVVESEVVTLTCSTSSSCPSKPHIQDVTQIDRTQVTGDYQEKERTTFSFTASREDHGRVFSCQTQDNTDKYLIRNITVCVKYKPRKTSISLSGFSDNQVKVGGSLTLTCDTDANPAPTTYSWYRSKNQQTDSQWNPTNSRMLHLTIQRADDACYRCSASNPIGRGDESQPVCIQVLYPPTEPILSMRSEVTEGQTITVSCTAESFPQSTLALMRINTNPQSLKIPENNLYSRPINTLSHKFNVTSADAGWYFCRAQNSEGSKDSKKKELVVKYSPKNVTVQANPGLVVNENVSLTLSCTAESNPPMSSVTWRKTTDGREEIFQQTQTFTVNSASPSDSGLYSCEATNDIGSGKSQPAEVKVRFAPKHTNIMESAEKQELDGRSSVMLSCISHSFPPVHHYSWYRKSKVKEKDEIVSELQNHKVYSNQPGVYYCIAQNEVDRRLSDPVHLFEANYLHILKFLVPALFVLMIVILIIVFLRYRRKKSIQQRTTNRTFLFGLLGWCNGTRRRSLTYENVSAEPFRSRDDLLSEQLRRPENQRRQHLPDSTPPTDINAVYSILNLPQAAQNPIRQQAGNTKDDSVNYSSLHFKNKIKNKQRKVEEDDVYAKVSKPTQVKKNGRESMPDYENISNATARAPTSPNLFDDNTSEGEVELDYSQVSFTATPRRQMTNRDSSSSDEDESSYSDIRI